jgi:hypothetical protein
VFCGCKQIIRLSGRPEHCAVSGDHISEQAILRWLDVKRVELNIDLYSLDTESVVKTHKK